jgi:lipoprotein-anchoring transpeptidase ErfK/SrfK
VHYPDLVRGLALTTALAVLLLSGCGGDDSGEGAKVAKPAATTPAQSKKCIAGSFHRLGSTKIAYVAVVRSRAPVFHRPGGPLLASFARRNVNRVPTIFSIRGARVDGKCNPRTYLVQVPRRPNGVTGWVSAARVHVETVRTRLLVDLSEKRVTLYKNGRKVLSSRAAIGSSATPTPVGRFYVNQRLIPYDPNGPFGPGAVGVSAFSEVLTGWTQGGPIAIHGTNAPWSIGKAVSNGCIRLPNPVLRRVFAQALAGTPVVIRR